MRRVLLLALVAALLGCRDNENPPAEEPSNLPKIPPPPMTAADSERLLPPPDTAVYVKIENDTLTLSGRRIAGGVATFILENQEAQQHILEIIWQYGARWRTLPVNKGGKVSLTVTMQPGPYEIFCAVPGHKQKGERGTFVVP